MSKEQIPEGWKVKRLGDLGDFKNGINKSKDDFGFGYPFVNLMDVFGEKTIRKSNFSLVNSTEKDRKEYSLLTGDVLFVRSSVKPKGVGLTSVLLEDLLDTTYSGFLIRFRTNEELINAFKVYCFDETRFRESLCSKSTISANTNINQVALKSLKISLPPLPEQQKIAAILSTWDQAIEKQDALLREKKQYKKGVMQQLLTGKKRFPGFVEEWEEVRLGDVVNSFSGGTPSRKKKEYYGGSIPWIKSGELNARKINRTEEFITELGLEESAAKMVEKHTLLIAMYGATAGVCAITNIKGAINQAVLAVVPNKNIDKMFLFQLMLSKMPKVVLNMVQGGQPNLSGGIINSIQLIIPSLAEQQKIASFLSVLDKEIEVLEKELEGIRTQKWGLMQRLLTGEIRVKT